LASGILANNTDGQVVVVVVVEVSDGQGEAERIKGINSAGACNILLPKLVAGCGVEARGSTVGYLNSAGVNYCDNVFARDSYSKVVMAVVVEISCRKRPTKPIKWLIA